MLRSAYECWFACACMIGACVWVGPGDRRGGDLPGPPLQVPITGRGSWSHRQHHADRPHHGEPGATPLAGRVRGDHRFLRAKTSSPQLAVVTGGRAGMAPRDTATYRCPCTLR